MRAPDSSIRAKPIVSVVIPTYRRPDLLMRCLRALCAQDIEAGAFEIIVCDDGCERRIAQLVADLAAEHRHAVLRYVAVPRTQGPAGARNAGARAARGGIIAFTDDDTIPTPDWLRQGCRALVATPAWSAVSGRTLVPTPPRPTDHERDTAGLATAEFVTANCSCAPGARTYRRLRRAL